MTVFATICSGTPLYAKKTSQSHSKSSGVPCQVDDHETSNTKKPPIEKFTIYVGKAIGYGGGNAWSANISFSPNVKILNYLKMRPPYKLSYGAGYYNIISSNNKSISFEGYDGFHYYTDPGTELTIMCKFLKW
ncbi:hypothetical protein [Novosphingobium arvoryzae]|uniref:hypothetical protein n=1 Tax=Novosphingobium arvoryzae TaxID=1256514 RepID=UPI001671C04C|nr:hypothetical protein [Novosphingobium arvoryzae]